MKLIYKFLVYICHFASAISHFELNKRYSENVCIGEKCFYCHHKNIFYSIRRSNHDLLLFFWLVLNHFDISRIKLIEKKIVSHFEWQGKYSMFDMVIFIVSFVYTETWQNGTQTIRFNGYFFLLSLFFRIFVYFSFFLCMRHITHNKIIMLFVDNHTIIFTHGQLKLILSLQ